MPEGQWRKSYTFFQSLGFFILAAVRYQLWYQTVTLVKISNTVRDTGHHMTFFYYPFIQGVMVSSALPLQIILRSNKYYLDPVKFIIVALLSAKKSNIRYFNATFNRNADKSIETTKTNLNRI